MITKLEGFVTRLYSDASFREIASSNPDKAVAMAGLSGADREGALQLCARLAGAAPEQTESFWN